MSEEDRNVGPLDRQKIWEAQHEHPRMSPERIGAELVKGLSKAELRAFAIAYIAGEVEGYRRAAAHRIETEAAEKRRRENPPKNPCECQGTQDRFGNPIWPHEKNDECRRKEQEQEKRTETYRASERARQDEAFEALRADPLTFLKPPKYWRWYPSEIENFQRSFDSSDEYQDWYENAVKIYRARVSEDKIERWGGFYPWDHGEFYSFASKFYRGGPVMYSTDQLIAQVSEEVRLETTRELLSTVFALGDGTEVTWGTATIEQHKQRIEMLTKNAAGIVETASRHTAAVRMIEEAGATCLADLAERAA